MHNYLVAYAAAASQYIALRDWGGLGLTSNPTLATGDVTISKDGGTFNNLGTLPSCSPASGVSVVVPLSSAELTCKFAIIKFVDQTSPKEWEDFIFRIDTYGGSLSLYPFIGAGTVTLASGTHIGATVPTVTNITNQVTAFVSNVVTSFVTNIVTAVTLGVATSAQIASAVWSVASSSYTDANFMGGKQWYLDDFITSRAPSSLTPTSIWAATTRTLTATVTAVVSNVVTAVTTTVISAILTGTQTFNLSGNIFGSLSGNVSGRVLGGGSSVISGVGARVVDEYGRPIQFLNIISSGIFTSATTLASSTIDSTNIGFLKQQLIHIISGSGVGQVRIIETVNSDSLPDIGIEVYSAWDVVPADGDQFYITAANAPIVSNQGRVLSDLPTAAITSTTFAASAITDSSFIANPTIGGYTTNALIALRKAVIGYVEFSVLSRSITGVVVSQIPVVGSINPSPTASSLDYLIGSPISLVSTYGGQIVGTRNIASVGYTATSYIFRYDRVFTGLSSALQSDTVLVGHTQSPLLTIAGAVSSVVSVDTVANIGPVASTAIASSVWTASVSSYTDTNTMGGRIYNYLTLSAPTSAQNASAIWAAATRSLTTPVTAYLASATHTGAIIPTVTRVLSASIDNVASSIYTTMAGAVWDYTAGILVPNSALYYLQKVDVEVSTRSILTSGQAASAIWNHVNRTLTQSVTAVVNNTVSAFLIPGTHTGVTIPNVTTVASANINLAQAVPATGNVSESIGDALNAARADGFGKWTISGTTLTLYAADGTTIVKTFTLDSSTAPTSRT